LVIDHSRRRTGPGSVPVTPWTSNRAGWTPGVAAARAGPARALPSAKALTTYCSRRDERRAAAVRPRYPVRVLVPSWVGIARSSGSADIEVSAQPLFSPWNTTFLPVFGPAHPEGGSAPAHPQATKSAFELARGPRCTRGEARAAWTVVVGRRVPSPGRRSTDAGRTGGPPVCTTGPAPHLTRCPSTGGRSTRRPPTSWPAPPTRPPYRSRCSRCLTHRLPVRRRRRHPVSVV